MKNALLKRCAVAVLAAVMVFTCAYYPARANEASVGTVAGPQETVRVTTGASNERERYFNDDWKFYLGDNSSAQNKNFDDSKWDAVTLPHDFSIFQNFTTSGEGESGFLPGGTGWYRKSFTMPAKDAGKSILLSFDGAYMHTYVYVNGNYVGENHYGYTAFAFDISKYLTCDGVTENVIAVKVVNNIPSSRWYSGSGIYRDVNLIVTEPVHIEHNGVYVTTPNIAKGDGTVKTEVELKNDSSKSAQVTVKNTVYNSEDVAVTGTTEKTVTVNAGATAKADTSVKVNNPALWSVDAPNMYYVHTEVFVDGTRVDTIDSTFGFRWYAFDANTGFSLNGVKMKLQGVCLHHDQGAAGSAAYYDAMYRQLKSMKDMGANAIRTSHNPADEQFIDICNELGLLVIEEAFDSWTAHKNGNNHDFGEYFNTKIGSNNQIYGGNNNMTWSEYAIKSMVKRDRNDPSVIMWSLGNELTDESNYPTIAQNLINWIKELDTTRPTTLGENSYPTKNNNRNYLSQVVDIIQNNGGVIGFNYLKNSNYHGLYNNMKNEWGTIYNAETASSITGRGIYTRYDDKHDNYHLTSYDKNCVGWGLNANDSIYYNLSIDYLAGEFVWTGWDYIGEPTPWNGTGTGSQTSKGAIPNSSYFGIVDTAGFEKDNYYLYRSQWNLSDTTLHLVTAWDSDNYYVSNGKTPVAIYSNAPKVELYRNGSLIGTATRVEHTTNAGFKYYTYNVKSNNSSVCSAVSASDGDSLMATFNVTYQAGTISAKAYDAKGNEIKDTVGNKVVNTPGSVTQLKVTQSKTVVDADGQSLVYISVDVLDANGNLDTTAANTINFSLSGNGMILGVDNGDQATTDKFQQKSVLLSDTSAKIKAYAGKALVIVRSTEEAGEITVNVTSNGLTGGTARITTNAVEDETEDGLVSYTMVRDYSVKAGTRPQFLTAAIGTMGNGSTVNGTIAWDAISDDTYNTAGDYTVNGTLTFANEEPIAVSAKLHVIPNVIALRNVSTVTTPGMEPDLPSTVRGVLADGTLSSEFNVTWDNVSTDAFVNVGDIVTVKGTATIIGEETLPVTCTVRVAKAVNTNSDNAARRAISLTQDVPAGKQSDNLNSVNNGYKEFVNNTSERWSNWNNRANSATATLTFSWHTAELLSSANIYYYYDASWSRKPEKVEFQYSLNGTDFVTVGHTETFLKGDDNGNDGEAFTYTFDEVVNPIAFRIIFTQEGGTSQDRCVAVIEAELMTFAGSVEYNDSAALSGITVDDVSVENFDANTLNYTSSGSDVAATTEVNAGITILPADENGVVRILTVSEDGSATRTYTVTLEDPCKHANTETVNAREATCTEDGYTGDTVCKDCGKTVKTGSVIVAGGHKTVLQNAKDATCTEAGYTGDTYCTVCETVIAGGEVIPATGHRNTEIRNQKDATCTEEGYTGDTFCKDCSNLVNSGSNTITKPHSWDSGVVTKPATSTEEGVKTFTCTVCGKTREELIPTERKAPYVTLTVEKGANGKIRLNGNFEDFENKDNYYNETGHGFVYITKTRLGAKSLTVNVVGRTKVTCRNYIAGTGSYTYSMTPTTASTRYCVRAWVSYVDDKGVTRYAYSNPIFVDYNSLS